VVSAEDDVGVEQRQQQAEVGPPGRGEEGVDDFSSARQIEAGGGRDALHSAPGATGELARRVRRSTGDRADLIDTTCSRHACSRHQRIETGVD
jgi:hypothetical protein